MSAPIWKLRIHDAGPSTPTVHVVDETGAAVFDAIATPAMVRKAHVIAFAPDVARVLQQALDESGCDGDLCAHRWHEAARAVLAKHRGDD